MTFVSLSGYNLVINQNNNYKVELEKAPDDCGENNMHLGVADYYRVTDNLKKKEKKGVRK